MKSTDKIELPTLSLGHCAALACQLEVGIAKPGNVHPTASFVDLEYLDFVIAGQIIGDLIDGQAALSLGEMIHMAASNTRRALRTNVNLGIVLLLCPLAKWSMLRGPFDSKGIDHWLRQLPETDALLIFEAIRIAAPGGLGQASESDVNGPIQSQMNIVRAMEYSRDRDQIARQWCTGFQDVLHWFAPQLRQSMTNWGSLHRAVIDTHLRWLARESDSLVIRKLGPELGRELQGRAQAVVELLSGDWQRAEPSIAEFDRWLRGDGHRRNPGTTADLICAGLFVLLVNRDFG